MQKMEATYYTAAQLAARGSGDIPRELVSNTHLIYSSPATLAFNSPGAEGYGVKRAGLAVPDSVMLIVSPGCCGRNTSAISRMPGYEDRFFYLTMDQTDLVTGRHLKKIPKSVAEICRGLEERGRRPRVVMICITCVDALLGTDMERICRRAQEKVPGVRVQPCYMYALTREGRKPPMVHVRQSIYELLEPRKKKASSVNILGFFAPVEEGEQGSEFFPLLRQAGIRKIRQIGSCGDYNEFLAMAEANFNLVLNPEARPAAYDLQERLGIPFIELGRFYQIDRIRAQYAALGRVLDTVFEDEKWEKEALQAAETFRQRFPGAVFSIGEAMNGNPFELACALVRQGFAVREIFGTVGKDSYVWINLLAQLSPDTRIYSNLHPSMLHYDAEKAEGRKPGTGWEQAAGKPGTGQEQAAGMPGTGQEQAAGKPGTGQEQAAGMPGTGQERAAGKYVTVSIGRDAGWYHPDLPNVQWNSDVQPFGYRAVTGLFQALAAAMETGSRGSHGSSIMLKGQSQTGQETGASEQSPRSAETEQADPDPVRSRADIISAEIVPRGFRRVTTPFAPDQSGAVSVLYDMGGICVICDAGGCTGNICGFDEPRWFGAQSAVFSAGLRDMDAILGRDDRLVDKLADAAQRIPASFASIVGTPVPAVIGTDYRALCRMASRRTGLPVLGIDSDGMEYYDKGIEKTYLALLETFCRPEKKAGLISEKGKKRIAGIWGFSPLDFAGILSAGHLRERIEAMGFDEMICCGAGTDIESLKKIGAAEKNFVLSPAGAAAAGWLKERYGTPWEYWIPGAENILSGLTVDCCPAGLETFSGKKVLIIHQQVLADALRKVLKTRTDLVDAAGFFIMNRGLAQAGDRPLREEMDVRSLVIERNYDYVIADRVLEPVLSGLPVSLIHLPHFAVSGDLSRD